ncbi:MAG TPA: DUF2191 domain-containing protein [Candidatus Paceibacterota bacterium]|nr:DUF2191 domain-containing protein [Verrucomicrobiota bacterium]HRY51397.1 DUF2191 domain-containing protein [Candidatus Paceibacterota bacterium]HSA00126.1 DUF2191 domain-containing protein [Candidatus Paceibacterota bacterium]
MKTTIDLADDLFLRAQRLARDEGTTLRALTEEGLRYVLERRREIKANTLPPLVTLKGQGLSDAFKDASWERIRGEIYPDPGA